MRIKTKCDYCGKSITINAPKKMCGTKGFSCNSCVPRNSAARDGINESPYVEAVKISDVMRSLFTKLLPT